MGLNICALEAIPQCIGDLSASLPIYHRKIDILDLVCLNYVVLQWLVGYAVVEPGLTVSQQSFGNMQVRRPLG